MRGSGASPKYCRIACKQSKAVSMSLQLDSASAQLKALACPSDGLQPVAKQKKMAAGPAPSPVSQS